MRVKIELSEQTKEPYAVIYAEELTEEIKNVVEILEQKQSSIITVKKEDRYIVVKPEEIYMIRMEESQVIIYGEKTKYSSSKRLYEFENQLGNWFLRISKTTLINLKQIESVEPSFNGMMYLLLKNGCKDYISRKYLPHLKSYLGI